MNDPETQPRTKQTSGPKVRFRCGHVLPVACLESGNCDACAKVTRIKNYKQRAARHRTPDFPPHVRLPDGTTKALAWYHGKVTGTMKVPGVAEPFRFSAPSERLCLHGLHQLYVQFLNRQQFQPQKPT